MMNALRTTPLFLSLLIAPLLVGCESFDSPPKASLPDLVEGFLEDPGAPLILRFHEPVNPDTLKVKVIKFETDAEGNLLDEDPDESTELDVIFQDDGPLDAPIGGAGDLDATDSIYTLQLQTTFPIGPGLAVVIEPGLQDLEGNEWNVRQLINFGFDFSCDDAGGPTNMPSGIYFFRVAVDEPLSLQLQLWADIKVDAATGNFVGQFTNADRDASIDCTQFGLSCDAATEVCRTLPEPQCVEPSQAMATVDEWPDYAPNFTPPTGYTFEVRGCVADQEDGSATFANAPVDVEVQSPPVTVKSISLASSFRPGPGDAWIGDGTFSAKEVFIGSSPSGQGVGTHTDTQVPADQAPSDVPKAMGEPGELPK